MLIAAVRRCDVLDRPGRLMNLWNGPRHHLQDVRVARGQVALTAWTHGPTVRDTFVPVKPPRLAADLVSAGIERISIDMRFKHFGSVPRDGHCGIG